MDTTTEARATSYEVLERFLAGYWTTRTRDNYRFILTGGHPARAVSVDTAGHHKMNRSPPRCGSKDPHSPCPPLQLVLELTRRLH
jgi:hypothetical protein